MQELQDALADWKRYQSIPRDDFFTSRDTRNMVFHAMMVAIQSAIDVATDIIAEKRLQKPATYRETFEILGENGIFHSNRPAHNNPLRCAKNFRLGGVCP